MSHEFEYLIAHLTNHDTSREALAKQFEQAASYLTYRFDGPTSETPSQMDMAEAISVLKQQIRPARPRRYQHTPYVLTNPKDAIDVLGTAAGLMRSCTTPPEFDKILCMADEGFGAAHGVLDFFAHNFHDTRAIRHLEALESITGLYINPTNRPTVERLPIPNDLLAIHDPSYAPLGIPDMMDGPSPKVLNSALDNDLDWFLTANQHETTQTTIDKYLNGPWRRGEKEMAELTITYSNDPTNEAQQAATPLEQHIKATLDYFCISHVELSSTLGADDKSRNLTVRISREDYYNRLAPEIGNKPLAPAAHPRYSLYVATGDMVPN